MSTGQHSGAALLAEAEQNACTSAERASLWCARAPRARFSGCGPSCIRLWWARLGRGRGAGLAARRGGVGDGFAGQRIAAVSPEQDAFVQDGGIRVLARAQGVDHLARGVVGTGAVGDHPGAVVGDAVEQRVVVIRHRDRAGNVKLDPIRRAGARRRCTMRCLAASAFFTCSADTKRSSRSVNLGCVALGVDDDGQVVGNGEVR